MRVAHADEHLALKRQRRAGSHLALGIGHAEIRIEPHHFAGGPHLGAQNDVLPDEFVERKHRFFHRPISRPNFLGEPQLAELGPGHHLRGELGQRFTNGFADKRDRPRGARVDLQHVHDLVLHRVLHIHQAGDLQFLGHGVRVLAHGVYSSLTEVVRRQHHGGVAGMHAGKFHMLEHAADHDRAILGVGNAVHIHLGGVFQKFIHQHRPLRRRLHRVLHVMAQLVIRIHNLHRAPAEHEGRPHEHGIAQFLRLGHRFLFVGGQAVRRLRDVQLVQHGGKHLAILRALDALRAGAEDVDAVGLQTEREVQRCLPAELGDGAPAIFPLVNVQDILECERFEKEFVARVVIGGHRLRIGVHHQRLKAILLQGKRRVHAAVIKLNALPDSVWATAEDHHLLAVRRINLVIAAIIGGIIIRRIRLELRRAGVH